MPSTPVKSGIARALDELQVERQHLAARLEKVDEAISTMRELFHLPTKETPRPARRARSAAPAAGNGHSELSDDAIRLALKNGPQAPGALAKALEVNRAQLRYRLRQLEAQGLIVSTGNTANRRVAWAGRPKEAL